MSQWTSHFVGAVIFIFFIFTSITPVIAEESLIMQCLPKDMFDRGYIVELYRVQKQFRSETFEWSFLAKKPVGVFDVLMDLHYDGRYEQCAFEFTPVDKSKGFHLLYLPSNSTTLDLIVENRPIDEAFRQMECHVSEAFKKLYSFCFEDILDEESACESH